MARGSYSCLICAGFLSFGTEKVLIDRDIYDILLSKNRFYNNMYEILCASLCYILHCIYHINICAHTHAVTSVFVGRKRKE